jgi:ribosome-associated protein
MPHSSKPEGRPAAAAAKSTAKSFKVDRGVSRGTKPTESLEFAIEAARLVRDDKCEDVVLMDVRELSQVTDFIIIGSGTSDRQMHSVLRHVEELGKGRKMPAFRSNADDRSTWLLLDFVDVVVHLFEPNTRAHYDLEMLWGDAPRLEWERPDQLKRDRAGLNA